MVRAAEQPESVFRYHWLWRLVLGVYWVGIFTLTHVPRLPPPPNIPQADKVAHFLVYALLAILWLIARHGGNAVRAKGYVQAWLLLAAYGAADELLQIPVGRSCDYRDWLADIAGISCGLALFGLGKAGWNLLRTAR